MSNRKTIRRLPPSLAASVLDSREDGLMDAIVTAAALVARADGWVEPVECYQLLDFLDRHGFLSVFSRREILDTFERRMRRLRVPGGRAAALAELRRFRNWWETRLILDVSEEIAEADGRLDPREEDMLWLIRTVHAARPTPAGPDPDRAGDEA